MTDRHFGALAQEANLLVERFNRAIASSELFFDSLASSNFVTGVSGFKIDTDGTAEFASGLTIGPGTVTISADLYSGNWDSGGGDVPDDLTSGPNASALLGYYLDYSVGAGQFQKLYARGGEMQDLSITGLLSVAAAGDIYSTAWDGTNPANIGTVPDSFASAGWWLDGQGAAQFQKIWAEGGGVTGDMTIGGTLTMDSGEIVTDAAAPRWRFADSTSDASVITNVLEYQYSAADYLHPKIAVAQDSIGMYARDNSAGADQAAVILRRDDLNTNARVLLTLDQGYNNDSAWLELWDVSDSNKGFELGFGTDFSASNLGAGRAAARVWNKGDGGALEVFGNPTSAEDVLAVFEGTPVSSETKLFTVNSEGPTWDDATSILPVYAYTQPADISSGIVNDAYTSMGTLTLWDHTGTNRSVVAQATGLYQATYTSGALIDVFIRVGISLDGGSTYAYGNNSDGFVGNATGGMKRLPMREQHQRVGTATGDVIARLEYYVVGATDPDSFGKISIMGNCQQLH